MLESKAEYARFATLYLGHAPRGMAAIHYTAPDMAGFAEAIRWLGSQLSID